MTDDVINRALAQKVAERLSEEMANQFSDILGSIVQDVLAEEGFRDEGDQYFERLMDVSSRIYIGAQ